MLNVRLTVAPTTDSEAVKTAIAKRAASAPETATEAWERILAMKNTDTDRARLLSVTRALEAGLIGRAPSLVSKRFSKAEALRMYTDLSERNRAATLREMVEETPDNYMLITTEAELQSLKKRLLSEEVIAVDTETTGVDVYTDR